MSAKVDLIGQRFGKLVVIKEQPRERDENGKLCRIKWLCQCDCGNTCVTTGACLGKGKTSCGCVKAEISERKRQQLAAARELAKKARAERKVEREDFPRCPYPDASCAKSKRGICCWDCEKYLDCEEKGRVCKNSPAKCGLNKNES